MAVRVTFDQKALDEWISMVFCNVYTYLPALLVEGAALPDLSDVSRALHGHAVGGSELMGQLQRASDADRELLARWLNVEASELSTILRGPAAQLLPMIAFMWNHGMFGNDMTTRNTKGLKPRTSRLGKGGYALFGRALDYSVSNAWTMSNMVCRHKALEHQMKGAATSASLKHIMRRGPGGYDYPSFSGWAAGAVMDSRAAERRAVLQVHVGAAEPKLASFAACKNPTSHQWRAVRQPVECEKKEMHCRWPDCKRKGKPSDFFYCSLCTDLSKDLVPMCAKCQWVVHNPNYTRTPKKSRKRTRTPGESDETSASTVSTESTQGTIPNTPHTQTDAPRILRRRL